MVYCDTLSIDPSLINVSGNATFEFNKTTNCINVVRTNDSSEVRLCYRVFPFRIDKPVFNRSKDLIDTTGVFNYKAYFSRNRPGYAPAEQREELFDSPGLNKTGNITRGISFGNTQNVFVNSSLNLQLEGKLTDDVKLIAAISDQNVPFQPEGNTQQLQEFEKVYIKMEHKRASLSAGDITIRNRPSQFLRYNKNVQGVSAEVYYPVNDSLRSVTFGEVAVAKGRFNSMNITPLEGVLGPYRLNGPNGEKFITILANSEKVWLDGKLLTRGFNFDYVIDYNSAEVTFTNKILITKFSRIRIDFEFTDRNYGRTVYAAGHYQNWQKSTAYLNVFNEADNPRNPINFKLNDTDKLYLSTIGDTLNKAYITGADSAVSFNRSQVFYEKKDTITSQGAFTIFKYSTDSTQNLWTLSFTDVDTRNGNYVQLNTTVNGRVFMWVAPVNGVPQGNYEPIRLIQTPKKRQMVNAGVVHNVSASEQVFVESAFSNNDINMYSKGDSRDDQGLALKTGYVNKGKAIKRFEGYKWNAAADMEIDNKYFLPMDRYRSIEFERDWQSDNIFTNKNNLQDIIVNTGAGVEKDNLNKINYRLSRRKRGSDVNGFQHLATFNKSLKFFQLNSDLFVMNNSREFENSDWVRYSIDPSVKVRKNRVGYTYRTDKNVVRSKLSANDSISRSLMYYEENVVYVKSDDSTRITYKTDYSSRFDYVPFEGNMQRNNYAQTVNGAATAKLSETNDLSLLATYRNLKYLSPSDSNKFDETIMGRSDWNARLFKNHIVSELTYVAGSGRELKRQYVYLPVPTGTGTHNWIDFNSDGVQDLNEFVEAINFDQRKFVKYYVPTNEYIPAFTNNLNYRLNINGPRNWRSKKGIRNFISRFSNTTAWNVDKKITNKDFVQRFNPLNQNIDSDKLIATNDNLRSTFFFNRTNPKYGLEYNYLKGVQKQLLTNGIDTRNVLEHRFTPRFVISKFLSGKTGFLNSKRGYTSEYLSQKNYLIRTNSVLPEIAIQPGNDFRLSLHYVYALKENILKDSLPETTRQHEAGMEIRWSKVSNRLISLTVKYINLDFRNGQLNSQLAFDMLEALKPGNNLTWNLSWQQKLVNGLQLNISYEGRKSEKTTAVHIGRMQVSALF